MKHGKRPTKKQKIYLKELKLNPDNWLIVKDCRDSFEIVHKISGKLKIINRG